MSTLDHAGLTVADLDAASSFFREVLGFTEERRAHLTGAFAADVVGVPGADIHTAILTDGASRVELLHYAAPRQADHTPTGPEVPGSMHVAVRVDDIEAVVTEAAAHGFTPRGRVATMPGGPRAGTRFIYLRDRTGATVELIEPA
ncbi:VOC family protein [Actinomycetospora sp. CA-084318]|uniref:VOC family protein n=1 Tax=Actinomycetospora sp. CA-084318 TaxID=3239892 RepID=UPI003D96B257